KLTQIASEVVRAGYQPAAHAIGDAANHAALLGLGKIQGKAPGIFPRIEHAQIVTPADAAAFGKAGLVASVQPMHMADDHAWTPTRLGPDRVDRAFPWRTFTQGGAKLVFGSDAPIADANPFLAMAAAETRQDARGNPTGGFLPEHRLTREETIRAYTLATAQVLGRKKMGVIKTGAVADLLWVQAPITTLNPTELRQLKPGRMWVNGVPIAANETPQ
ncbi:MAG: amidohydrolase family protein, partial [Holophaga sp.]|nr:amidohydrolase family protein [Holophaga sp.]